VIDAGRGCILITFASAAPVDDRVRGPVAPILGRRRSSSLGPKAHVAAV